MGMFFKQNKPRQFHLPGFDNSETKRLKLEKKEGRRTIRFKRKTKSGGGIYSLLVLIACLAVVVFLIKFFS